MNKKKPTPDHPFDLEKYPKMFEPLNVEEAEIMEERERGDWNPVSPETQCAMLEVGQKQAKEALKKSARINIRLAPVDLEGLKNLAAQAGLPYQTYIGMILHQHVTGQR